jgi:hypothetical protein
MGATRHNSGVFCLYEAGPKSDYLSDGEIRWAISCSGFATDLSKLLAHCLFRLWELGTGLRRDDPRDWGPRATGTIRGQHKHTHR